MRFFKYISATLFLFTLITMNAGSALAGYAFCDVTNVNGEILETYWAVYTESNVAGPFEGEVKVDYLRSYKPGEYWVGSVPLASNERWKVTEDRELTEEEKEEARKSPWKDPDSNTKAETTFANETDLTERAWQRRNFPYITTPNGKCSIHLVKYGYESPNSVIPFWPPAPNTGKGLALIGDSNAWGYTNTLAMRKELIQDLGKHGWRFSSHATSGMTWYAPDVPNYQFEPGYSEDIGVGPFTYTGRSQHDELSGLLNTQWGPIDGVDAVVFNLGMNDANGHIATADSEEKPAIEYEVWYSMYSQIYNAAQKTDCVLVINVHDPEIDYWWPGSESAVARINSWIHAITSHPGNPNIHLVDWAGAVNQYARMNRIPEGGRVTMTDWFFPETGPIGAIHMSDKGYQAVKDLWMEEFVDHCK